MKQINLYFFTLFFLVNANCQPLPDNIKQKYILAKTSQQKAEAILEIDRPSNADSQKITQMIALREWFKKNNDPLGASYTELFIAEAFMFKDDSDISLKMVFPLLKKFEKENDVYGKMRCYHTIGMSYSATKSYDLSFEYLKKAIAIAKKNNYIKFLTVLYNNIGVVYFEANQPQEGIVYAQKAVQLDTKNNDLVRLSTSLSTVGENYMAAKSYDIALPFLRRAYQLSKKQIKSSYSEVYSYNDMAEVFLGLNQLDSAIYYVNKSVTKSTIYNYKTEKLRSYNTLLTIYKKINNQDSLNKYYPLLIETKDELFNSKKLRSIENSNFAEQLRQRDKETEKAKIENERKNNLQYAFIALGIISFLILFLMLSRSIIVKEKWISFFGILGLLIVFEFINLLIHPFLEEVTHHSPILMLLCLVALASLLIPLHHKLEHWIKDKMTKKNKEIRLANAKKTIEELDEKK